jgi:hypothetical protein
MKPVTRRVLTLTGVIVLLMPDLLNAAPADASYRPRVSRVPTSDELVRVYKKLKIKGQPLGWALLQCHVDEAGVLDQCHAILEAPENGVASKVALGLAAFMRITPAMENGRPTDGGFIFIPLGIGAQPVGGLATSYAAGSPSFAALPTSDPEPSTLKIPCPTVENSEAVCPARGIYWSNTLGMEETAPTILGAQQPVGFSAVSCQFTAEQRLEDCRIKGEEGPLVVAAIHKILPTLKSPKWRFDDKPIEPTRVTIVYDWAKLTKASAAIVAAQKERSSH